MYLVQTIQTTFCSIEHIFFLIIQIEKSQNVVIVGGGAVGVEFAGEIVDKYPDKQVTIIHSNANLVTKNFGEKFCENIKDQLEKSFKVNLLLGEILY